MSLSLTFIATPENDAGTLLNFLRKHNLPTLNGLLEYALAIFIARKSRTTLALPIFYKDLRLYLSTT